uniref:NADH-ubiquinone oxidoreductase chain 6 n=1 Tax=Vincenzellus ruficollis TaxID=295991 RepID=A0A343A424_9CUCU|nr:NADH dehydrogenase subunit 6 [Vincenzellus ruficollis]AOY39302.1 NADH dehydrogenase subunit 6 [Vincenzellus ruficollis]
MLFLMNLTLSLMFLFLTHPLSAGLILLIQTMIISLITGNFFINYWFSYILFLIMIGGMLILFIYMTSIASNEKFSFKYKILFPLTSFLIIIMFPLIFFYLNLNIMNNENMIFNQLLLMNSSLNKFFSYPLMLILFFIIIYLFITLIAVVKITNFNIGPLRQMS